ncbi:MAG TPA: DMT family transporter, partial [Micromonosporaceae bacterium]
GLALMSAAGYAAVTLLQRRAGADGSAVPAHRAVQVGFAIAAVLLLPFAATEGILPGHNDPLWTVVLLGYLGAVPMALAYSLFFAALGRLRAATASVVALLEPVTATVIAVTLLGERLTPTATAGVVIMATAVLLHSVELRTLRRR